MDPSTPHSKTIHARSPTTEAGWLSHIPFVKPISSKTI